MKKIQANVPYVHSETAILVIVTKLSALSHRDREAATNARNVAVKAYGAHSDEAQPIGVAIPALREIHASCVQDFLDSLEKWGYKANLLNSGEFLQESKSGLYGREQGSRFWPQLMCAGVDSLSVRHKSRIDRLDKQQNENSLNQPDPTNPGSKKNYVPRPLHEQLLHEIPASYDNDKVLHLGQRFLAPIQVIRHARSPSDFDSLVARIKQVGIPVRIAFHLTDNGLASLGWASTLAGILHWTGPVNAAISKARNTLREHLESSVPALSITAATWSPAVMRVDPETRQSYGVLDEISIRRKKLIDAFSDWGEVTANQRYGNGVEVFFNSCPGLTIGHHIPACPAPLLEVAGMLPLCRLAPAWEQGTHVKRTKEGQVIPYEQMSGAQKAWITALVGPQGTGKSTEMFLLNFYLLIQPASESSLPFIRAIDFQESQRGLVDLVRGGLPPERLHEAQFVAWKNDESQSTNVFDLLLGLSEPMPEHRKFLISFLALIVQSLKQYKSRDGLIGAVVHEAYRYYRNDLHNTNAKRYSPGFLPEVDEAILKHGITAERDVTTWWALRDDLFDVGEKYLASQAQGRAMPIMEDLTMIAASEAIIAEYPDVEQGLPVIELFSRGVREALLKFQFLRGYTKFSMSETRVGFLDLASMVTKGIREQDRLDNAVIMFAAMRLLVSDFWYNDDDLKYFREARYRNHARDHFNNIQSVAKRFGADEIHRFDNINEAKEIIDQLNAEGRKNYTDILLATQQLMTHTPSTRKLATTVIICGLGSAEDMQDLQTGYKFSDSEVNAIAALKGPSKDGGNSVMRFLLKDGTKQVVNVFATEGPKMLWAAATEQVDRTLRRLLYKRLPQAEARRRLALVYPSGSVKSAVEERQRRLGDRGEDFEEQSDSIIMDIIEELCDHKQFTSDIGHANS